MELILDTLIVIACIAVFPFVAVSGFYIAVGFVGGIWGIAWAFFEGFINLFDRDDEEE